MERNEKLAGLILQKTAAAAKPARNYFLEGYLQGYMNKEAQAADGKGIDWGGMWKGVQEGAGKLMPKNWEEGLQAAGGAGLGALAGGALGGWKGAIGGGLLGGAGAGAAARYGYTIPGLSELIKKIEAYGAKSKAAPAKGAGKDAGKPAGAGPLEENMYEPDPNAPALQDNRYFNAGDPLKRSRERLLAHQDPIP